MAGVTGALIGPVELVAAVTVVRVSEAVEVLETVTTGIIVVNDNGAITILVTVKVEVGAIIVTDDASSEVLEIVSTGVVIVIVLAMVEVLCTVTVVTDSAVSVVPYLVV